MEEEEKKRRRNKKKKNNKQTKTTTTDNDAAAAVGRDQNHVTNGQQNDGVHQTQVSETAEIQNGLVDLDDNGHHQSNVTESAILAEAERHKLLRREAILQGTIKELQSERESHIQLEATLEEKIKQLQNDSDSNKQKVATLEETIKQLRNENDLHMQKEATLEETIKQLKNENYSRIQKEGVLEMNIGKLQSDKDIWLQKKDGGLEMTIAKLLSEKDIWLQKQADLEGRISRLQDESAALNMKGASLAEKIKLLEADRDSWIRMEGVSKETITSLNIDITQLQMQVVELEESRNNLLQENQLLKENVASLQFQLSSDAIKKDTSEPEDLNSQIEAACVLVDKLITENVELVEKVNELSVKLERQSAAFGVSSASGSDPMITIISDTEPPSESSENMPPSNHKLENREPLAVKEERNRVNHLHMDPAPGVINSSEADYSGEIVQIPLHDNEIEDLESQVAESNEQAGVPLTDAPLIGAPFRLVSFVAKYVSGADLVNKNSSNSGS